MPQEPEEMLEDEVFSAEDEHSDEWWNQFFDSYESEQEEGQQQGEDQSASSDDPGKSDHQERNTREEAEAESPFGRQQRSAGNSSEINQESRMSRLGKWAEEKLPNWAYTVFWGTLRFIGKVIRTVVFGDEKVVADAATNFNDMVKAERKSAEADLKNAEAEERRQQAQEAAKEAEAEAQNEAERQQSRGQNKQEQEPESPEPVEAQAREEDETDLSAKSADTSKIDSPEKAKTKSGDEFATITIPLDLPARLDKIIKEEQEKAAQSPSLTAIVEKAGYTLVSDEKSISDGRESVAEFYYTKKEKEYHFFVPAAQLQGKSEAEITAAIKEGKDIGIAERFLEKYNSSHHTNIHVLAVGRESFVLGEEGGQSISCSKKDLGGNISRAVSNYMRLAERDEAGQATISEDMYRPVTSRIEPSDRSNFASYINSVDGQMSFAREGFVVSANEMGDELYIMRGNEWGVDTNRSISWILSQREIASGCDGDFSKAAELCGEKIDNGLTPASDADHKFIKSVFDTSMGFEAEFSPLESEEESQEPEIQTGEEPSIDAEAMEDQCWWQEEASL